MLQFFTKFESVTKLAMFTWVPSYFLCPFGSWSVREFCYVQLLVHSMPFFAMISSCSMLFDSSKHCNLMLFLPCPVNSAKSVNLLLFAILPCPFEHVIIVSGVSSVSMFCNPLPLNHFHAFFFMLRSCRLLF